MSWTKVAANRYERPTDAIETVTQALGLSVAALGREHWIMSCVAQFDVDGASHTEVFDLIRSAWTHLRYNHPAIAVTLEGTTLSYEVPDRSGLQEWLSSTAVLEEDRSLPEYLSSAQPTKYNTIHYFPDSSKVLIRMHHWLLDGTGGVAILDKLFQFLVDKSNTEPDFGDEWKHLPPSFTEAAPLVREPTPAMKSAGGEMFANFVSNLPSIGLPYSAQMPGGTKVARISKDQGFGEVLRSKSRAIGSSVASSVHAALIVTTGQMGMPELSDRNYTSMALFDYRSYLQLPYRDVKSWPAGCYLAVIPFTLPQADFTTQAQALYKMYRQPLRREDSSTMDGWPTYLEHLGGLVAHPPPPGTPLPSQPQLSSLGILDRYIKSRYDGVKSLSVEDVEIISDQMTPTIVLTQWSFNGDWHLSACYNENLYEESFVTQLLDTTFKVLIQGLGISS